MALFNSKLLVYQRVWVKEAKPFARRFGTSCWWVKLCYCRLCLSTTLLCTNNVLVVKIEGLVWYTIYHHLPIVEGVCYTHVLINQPTGKGHL